MGHTKIDVLKMDIEGAEYGVIADLCSGGAINKVGQFLVEFHHWMPGISVGATKRAIELLRGAGLRANWVSPNGHEVLFSRLSRNTNQTNGV